MLTTTATAQNKWYVTLMRCCYSFQYVTSVIRLDDLLDSGQLFKDFGNHKFAQISHILTDFCKCVKRIIFLAKSFLGNFYIHLAILFWSHCTWTRNIATLYLLHITLKWHLNGIRNLDRRVSRPLVRLEQYDQMAKWKVAQFFTKSYQNKPDSSCYKNVMIFNLAYKINLHLGYFC